MAKACIGTNRAAKNPRVYIEDKTGYATTEISCMVACPSETKEQFEKCLEKLESAANLFKMCMIDWQEETFRRIEEESAIHS